MRNVIHLSKEELRDIIAELRSNRVDKAAKRDLATLRANFAEQLYNLSEPIERPYYNSDGEQIHEKKL